ncbi:MAG: hypothetical protein R2848_01470 [Thermomicrobiales bacterium]
MAFELSAPTSRLSRRTALAAAALAGFGGFALATHGVAAHDEGTPSAAGDETAYLFVQSGFTSGMLDQATDGVQSWMLTLQGAPAQTVFFSDRPARIAGSVSTERFLELLDFSSDDPPNAALVIDTESGADVVILELTDPVYDAGDATLTYIAKILDVDVLESSGYGFESDPLGPDGYPAEFGPASLFIDSLLGCTPWDPRC